MLFFSFIIEADGYLELTNPWTTISNQKIKFNMGEEELKNLLERIKREATERGQFFI